jgi:hypothetical protein
VVVGIAVGINVQESHLGAARQGLGLLGEGVVERARLGDAYV